MSTCRDCIHFDLCLENAKEELKSVGLNIDLENLPLSLNKCQFFKDKSKIVELPINIDDTVFRIVEYRSVLYPALLPIANVICEEKIVYIRFTKKGIRLYTNTFDFLQKEIGKTVFTSKDEAEKALINSRGD